MPRPEPLPTQLDRDLADLKLLEIAKCYREVLDDAARKGCSMLEVLATLIGTEQTYSPFPAHGLRAGGLDNDFGRRRSWPVTSQNRNSWVILFLPNLFCVS